MGQKVGVELLLNGVRNTITKSFETASGRDKQVAYMSYEEHNVCDALLPPTYKGKKIAK
jgi:DNA-directed RNA polymerase beta subunit